MQKNPILSIYPAASRSLMLAVAMPGIKLVNHAWYEKMDF